MTKSRGIYMKRSGSCSVEGCGLPVRARGLCSIHYQRQERTGSPLGKQWPTIEERFWSKVNKTSENGCWLWTGTLSRGYGWFFDGANSNGPGDRGIGAHRWLYERTVGPVPAGLVLDHICHDPDNCSGGEGCPHRACVNPAHLKPTTSEDNVRRGVHVDTQGIKTHCPQGHPYDEANTYRHRKQPGRSCRACAREKQRRYRAAKRGRSSA